MAVVLEPIFFVRRVDPFKEKIRNSFRELVDGIGDEICQSSGPRLEILFERRLKAIEGDSEANRKVREISVLFKDALKTQFLKNEDGLIPDHARGLVQQVMQERRDPFVDAHLVEQVIPEISEEQERYICLAYAFSQLGEKRYFAKEYGNEEIPQLLYEWGYRPVEKPEPGDLVLFVDREDGFVAHSGIYREEGWIQSKWGDEYPRPFKHRIEDVPKDFGDLVVYFRPPVSSRS